MRAFAKAYAYALIKAEDEEGIRAFHSLIGSVLEELGLHASFSEKWGVDVKNVSENVAGSLRSSSAVSLLNPSCFYVGYLKVIPPFRGRVC